MKSLSYYIDRFIAGTAASLYGGDGSAVKDYERTLAQQKDPYGEWIKHVEPEIMEEALRGGESPTASGTAGTVQMYAKDPSCLDPRAMDICIRAFEKNPGLMLWYADEDLLQILPDGTKKRVLPWFKPEWSPLTLRSFFYIGSFFAVRPGDESKGTVLFDSAEPFLSELYNLRDDEVCHTAAVLYHTPFDGAVTEDPDYADLPCFREIVNRTGEPSPLTPRTSLQIRIVIPTKDHPELLERMLSSFVKNTDYPTEKLEFRIVDNGSTDDAKRRCRKVLEDICKSAGLRYSYDCFNAEFNFSYMCNRGAEGAEGLLLFLNDDVEITESDPVWLQKMADTATDKSVGAVGAKLYYPEKDEAGNYLIQHAGITNLEIGPGHKLLRRSDDRTFYYGYGTLPMEMLAVTGACLMVEADRFREVKGFPEELAIAYNDVSLCMRLKEAGYRNIQRNDIKLIHHESVSRGSDETPENRSRRMKELGLLYKEHTGFKGYDPYYSRNLRGDSDAYTVGYRYPYENEELRSVITQIPASSLPRRTTDIAMTSADRVVRQGEDGSPCFVIEGWAFLRGADNALFEKKLVLAGGQPGQDAYIADVWERYRPDVEAAFPDEKRTALSGFVARFDISELKKGKYNVYIFITCGRRSFLAPLGVEFMI